MWISQIYDVDKYLTPHPVWIYPRWHEELRKERIWCFLPPSSCFQVFHYKLYPPTPALIRHCDSFWLSILPLTSCIYLFFLANSGLSCLWVFGHSVLLSSNHHLASTLLRIPYFNNTVPAYLQICLYCFCFRFECVSAKLFPSSLLLIASGSWQQ